MDYRAILVLLCIISGTTAQFNVVPSHTVVLDGAPDTTLSCTPSTATNDMYWFKPPDGTIRIVEDCVVVSGYDTLYSVVHNLGTGQCDLVIINANASVAGQYRCTNLDAGTSRYADLVVLDSAPGGTQRQHPIAGEQMWFECSVNYTTGTVVPYFNWTDNGQDLIIDSNSATDVSAISRAYIDIPVVTTTPPADIKPVTCTMNFPSSPTPTIYTPYNWTSDATINKVQYPPTKVDITAEDDSLDLNATVPRNTVIICSAEAYPVPTYQWRNFSDSNKIIGSGPRYTLNVSGEYMVEAVATSTIIGADGRPYDANATATLRVNVSNTTAPTTTTTKSTPGGSVPCHKNVNCIVPAIVVPISVVIIIAIICCCIWIRSCPCYDSCERCRPRNCPCNNEGKRASDGSGSQGSADRMTSPQTQTPTYTQHPNQGYNGNYQDVPPKPATKPVQGYQGHPPQPDVTYSQPHHNPAGSRPYNASQNNPPRTPPPPLVSPEGIIYADLATCNPGSRKPVVAPSETVYASIATA